MNTGWVKVHRSFDQSEAAHFPPCTREVWFYLIRNVNHADNGEFKRGSGLFALEDIQDVLSWTVGYRAEKYSKPQLTKALRRLREARMIETAKATRGLFVTVSNYTKHQDRQNGEGNDESNEESPRRKCEGMHYKQEEKKEETTLRKSAGKSTHFDEFWKSYPRKKNKVDAAKAWKQSKGDSIFNEILDGLGRAVASADWQKDDGRFIPYPASWLRAGGWMDETGSPTMKACQACRHYPASCQGKNETCSAYEAKA